MEQEESRRKRRGRLVPLPGRPSPRAPREESIAWIRQLLERLEEAVAVTDLERTRVFYVSPAFSELSGRSQQELASSPRAFLNAVHPEDLAAVIAAVRKLPERSFEQTLRFLHADGEIRHAWVRAGPLYGPDGELLYIAWVARDVTDRRRSEAERREYALRLEQDVRERTQQLERANQQLRRLRRERIQAERMEAAEVLAGSLAQAINNPLTALIGTAQMSLEGGSAVDPQMARVLRLAERIRDVAARTLQLFHEGTLQLSPEEPGRLLAEVRDELLERACERDVGIELRVPARLPSLSVDRALLRTALGCVAENALDASPRGGTVWLEIAAAARGQAVRFRVGDDGPGVPEALRERIFEPFFTTRGMAAGLGLAIARDVVRRHGGRIEVADRADGGTWVTVEVPVEPAEAATAEA